MPIGILLVDDSPTHVDLLRILIELEDDLEVVGVAHNGEHGVRLAAQLDPDVIVSDIEMPGLDGIRSVPLYRSASPAAAVVLMSTLDPTEAGQMAERAGADLYIDKVTGVDTMIQMLRSAFLAKRARPEVINLLEREPDDMSRAAERD